jgi:hypothetical protein
MRSRKTLAILAALALMTARLGAQTVLTAGTKTPFKLTRTLGGNFLLAEGGTGADDGKVTLVSLWGNRYNLLSGLPSGVTPEGSALGPTGVADAHGTLYITIGEGDARIESTQPPQQVPNPEISSPIFSSLLRARFTPVPDGIRTGFALTSDDIASLTDGNEITLHNDSGESVSLLILTDFRDFIRDPVLIFRQSNPFGAAVVGSLTEEDLAEFGFTGTLDDANFAAGLDPTSPLGARLEQRTTVYVADAGMNTIVQVAASTGRARVLTRFALVPNPLFPSMGGPASDPVPTSVSVRADGTLLVTTLGGFPFASGTSSVWNVDPATGAATQWISGLTRATNVLEVGGAIYALEVSTDLLAGAPGQLLRFDTPTATPAVVAGGLIGPTGLAYDPHRNELIVSETFTGLVKRIALTQ